MPQTLKNSFTFALRRSLPIMVGFFPVGAAYGILMAQAGYGPLWSALCGVIVAGLSKGDFFGWAPMPVPIA